jgi:DNA polymerase
MSWDERQRAMLEAMGLKVWARVSEVEPEAAPSPRPVAAPVPETVAAPVPAPVVARPSPAPVAVDTSARAQAIAGMGWAELRESVAGCRACGLCESRKNTVFGVGHENADWMVIGEAPGQQEDLRGEPFVGDAGQLLDNMLRAIGLSRSEGAPGGQVFIANTLKCRPPSNRNPEPEELAQCEPYLRRQIELVQPRIILAMGRFAVQSLLRSSEAIGRLRGRVHEINGVPVIVTYHPAYLLRNMPDKALAWDDLCLAKEVHDAAGTQS